LPCTGIIPLSDSLDHVGPLARSVSDARLVYQAMHGHTTNEQPGANSPRRLALGILRPYFMEVLDDDVRHAVEDAVRRLTAAGVTIQDRAIAQAADIASIYLHIQLPEASAYHAEAIERTPEAYTAPVRLRLEMGRYVQAEDYYRARNGARVLQANVDAALDGVDALVLPTLPIVAPYIGSETVMAGGQEVAVRAMMLRLTQLFDITGHPAVSVPCGHSLTTNLPIGLQLVGRRHATSALLDVAAACEAVMALRT